MTFLGGNKDGKHYWLTPPDLMRLMQSEFHFNFDACPFPLPEGFNGLTSDWGGSTYVNPPFGSIVGEDGKKKGPTAWARKSILEAEKGNDVVMVYPVDKWVLMLLEYASEVRNLGDVKWCATEDGKPGRGNGRHVAMFILKGKKKCRKKK